MGRIVRREQGRMDVSSPSDRPREVMLMVEAGELGLDNLVDDQLSEDLRFDTNGASIRQVRNRVRRTSSSAPDSAAYNPAIGHAQAFGPYNHPCGMSCPGYLSASASTCAGCPRRSSTDPATLGLVIAPRDALGRLPWHVRFGT